MIPYNCIQYSPMWWQLRCGLPTASAFDKILTPAKGDKSKSARPYMYELAAELAGYHLPNFFTERDNRPKSYAMAVGTETEPEARRYYALHREVEVKEVGFCLSDCGRYGCSPDGVIATSPEGAGGLELKCPEAKTHFAYCFEEKLPDEYKCQVHGQLVVTGWKWIDFMSYVPHIPHNTFLIRVYPDAFTEKLQSALIQFGAEYDDVLKRLGLTENRATADAWRAEQGKAEAA